MYDPATGVFTWRVSRPTKIKPGDVAGNVTPKGYVSIGVKGKIYRAHRLAWLYTFGKFPSAFIDHINGDRTDNRLVNLREATNQENQQNIKGATKSSKHGVLGAAWHNEANRWFARISFGGKRIHLGYFDTAKEAGEAYLEAKRKLHKFNTL